MVKRKSLRKTQQKPAQKPRRYIDRVTGKQVSKRHYDRFKGTGRFVDQRRSQAAKKAAKTRALTQREADRLEVLRLADVVRKRQKISKAKALEKAKKVVGDRRRKARRKRKHTGAVKKLPTRTWEYEAKVPYKSRRDGAQVLINLRMRFTGKIAPSDAEIREVMYQALRVEGKPRAGWKFDGIDWRNAQARFDINQAPARDGGESDLTAFQSIVSYLGPTALEIGEV